NEGLWVPDCGVGFSDRRRMWPPDKVKVIGEGSSGDAYDRG
nr:hypothetical protein [Tanacetum cinerariifolium]